MVGILSTVSGCSLWALSATAGQPNLLPVGLAKAIDMKRIRSGAAKRALCTFQISALRRKRGDSWEKSQEGGSSLGFPTGSKWGIEVPTLLGPWGFLLNQCPVLYLLSVTSCARRECIQEGGMNHAEWTTMGELGIEPLQTNMSLFGQPTHRLLCKLAFSLILLPGGFLFCFLKATCTEPLCVRQRNPWWLTMLYPQSSRSRVFFFAGAMQGASK